MSEYPDEDLSKLYGNDDEKMNSLNYTPDEEDASRYISSGGKHKKKTRKHKRGGKRKSRHSRKTRKSRRHRR